MRRLAIVPLLVCVPSLAAADRVAFTRGHVIVAVPSAGGAETVIVPAADDLYSAAVSRDGTMIVVEHGGDHHHLDVRPVGGKPIAIDAGVGPLFAPDGKHVAYACAMQPVNPQAEEEYDLPAAICVVGADGKGKRQVTPNTTAPSVRLRGWSHDGASIVWTETRSTDDTFVSMPVAGGKPKRGLVVPKAPIYYPGDVSADGARYVWSRGDKIYIAAVDGGGEVSFGPPKINGAWCAWSPDSAHVACTVELASADKSLQVFTADGKTSFVLDAGADDGIVWSRDSTRIAYRHGKDLAVVDAKAGAKPVMLTHDGSEPTPLAWLP